MKGYFFKPESTDVECRELQERDGRAFTDHRRCRWLAVHRRAKSREVAAQYVEMAVDIMKNKELSPENGRDLRKWAVQVVNEHSVVKMDTTVQRFVTEGGLVVEEIVITGGEPPTP